MKNVPVLFSLLTILLLAPPAFASQPVPKASAVTAARTVSIEQKYLEQAFVMSGVSSFSADTAAHTARLTGRGSAQMDNGQNSVGAGSNKVDLDITFTNTDNAVFRQCQDGLAKNPPPRTVIISGHGYFNLNLNNGTVDSVAMTLADVTSCTAD